MNQATAEELASLRRELEAAGGQGPMDRLLTAAGDLLRRSEEGRAEIDAALTGLPRVALEEWERSIDLVGLRQALLGAAEAGIEAGMPEESAERETWTEWAWKELCARDRLESSLAALERAAALGSGVAGELRDRLGREVAPVDRELRPRARWLAAVNPKRRAERELLLGSARERAWWFTARADCDALVPMLAGEREDSAHLGACADCRRDLEIARGSEVGPRARLGGE